MTIAVLGAGAFGTALAISLAQRGPVLLWARDAAQVAEMRESRRNDRRLPGAVLPEALTVTDRIEDAAGCDIVLLGVPMQKMGGFLSENAGLLDGKVLVSCSKGIDLATGRGSVALIEAACPGALAAVLTGPSFAADIARGLPTALTLACRTDAPDLQARLSTPTLRLYRTTDMIGAELGGALKNVIAIAAGVVIGANLGDSARAALMTRGFAEMNRLAMKLGARPETLMGLSGFGDLVLTCTSLQSRNFRYGIALGSGSAFDPGVTVEGAATARAVTGLARDHGLEMPIAAMIAALCAQKISVADAVTALLSRPLKEE
ncbi:NAD(P)H-dependent glycerol-3-phosphate dehydrogenase [Rhodobacter capsulatus]|uniref:NAD(P)H-dependent glycerol-3-phosphate dehydrogenase n=1 Tax=Rhodobacter capsulatus TaxID=1061 RepID=UPI0003D3A898|nr:NAD(P)H-dependent glycerol-3-phosphate dehydrogenase [Rhodobacter capsulatus]ETD88026.1 glycerol-3-phosphate dehydrogenase [Rhodobacter capsulatus YW2]